MPNIPSIKIGDTTYDVKDQVARDHLVEVGTTTPTHPDNRLYVKDYGSVADEDAHTYIVITKEDFEAFAGELGTKQLVFNQDGSVSWINLQS